MVIVSTCAASPESGPGSCGSSATPVHAIQGDGAVSPLIGSRVEVEAVVVGDYQHTRSSGSSRAELAGFYIQEEYAHTDDDNATSEGLFVHDPRLLRDIAEGDLVRVSGVVTEYQGLTELFKITALVVCQPGVGERVRASIIDLPVPASFADLDVFYEQYEGMLVSFADVLTVTDQSDLARYGQLVLSKGGRLRQYSQDGELPLNAVAWAAAQAAQQRRSIRLDDFSDEQNNDPVFHPQPGGFAVDNTLRTGAITTGLRGVLEYRHDEWRLHPQKSRPVTFINPGRPAAPQMQGNLVVASMNLMNYFNGDGLGGGMPTTRGADSAGELDRQTEKIVSAIREMNPDVLGLMEIAKRVGQPGQCH